MNKKQLQAAIRRLVRAEINNSWKGGGDPDYIPLIEKELKSAKRSLRNIIDKIPFPAISEQKSIE